MEDVGDVVFYQRDKNYSSLAWTYLKAAMKKVS